MKVVRMEFPDKKDRDVVTLKNISSYRRFIQVVLATPSGAASLPVVRSSTVRQAIFKLVHEVNDVRTRRLHTLKAKVRQCLPMENFRMDRLWDYEGYIGLVPWRSPFSNITKYYSRVTEVLGLVFSRDLINIISAYNKTTSCLQELDLCETVTHALDARIEYSATDGARHKPIFITMAFTAEQLYGAYPGLCPIMYRIKGVKTGQTFATPITTDFFYEKKIRFHFDYKKEHRADLCLQYLCEQQLLRSNITFELVIGLQIVSFYTCRTAGRFVAQVHNMGQVLEQVLRCYEAFLAVKGTNLASIGHRHDRTTIFDADPLLQPTTGTVAHKLPRDVRLCAHLTLCVEMESLSMSQLHPLEEMTFRSYVYEMAVDCLLNTVHQKDDELKGSQVVLEMADNSFLLILDPVRARRVIMQEFEKQQKDDELYEDISFDSFMGCHDGTKVPMDQMVGRGVLTLPWLEFLMEMDHEHALRIMGLESTKVVISQYCFRTPISVNHGSALRASKEKSRLVSDMQGSATRLPAIVQKCIHARTNPLTLNYTLFRLWWLLFDSKSFDKNVRSVAAALDIELSVIAVQPPGFDIDNKIENFTLPTQNECSDEELYHRVEEHFHLHAMKKIRSGCGQVKLPCLWGSDHSADQVRFYVLPNPISIARRMFSWGCISAIGDRVKLDCARLLVGNSILKDVHDALPQCPGSTFLYYNSMELPEPLQVPEGTPVAILQLAIDLRIDKCGCGMCTKRFLGRAWSIGSALRDCLGPCQSVFPIRMMCFNDPDGPRVRPVEGANFDITSLRWESDILRCLSQPAQAYLLESFHFSHSTGMSSLLMGLCNITYTSETTGPWAQCLQSIIPLHRHELRYSNSYVRFIWKVATPQLVL